MFSRIYIEITNICNMKCSFCPGTKRQRSLMTPENFESVLKKIKGEVEYIYLHVMGEPLLHPELDKLLKTAGKLGFKVCITTNGTLLDKAKQILKDNADTIHRVSISLHAPEGNGMDLSLDGYMDSVISFAKEFSSLDKNVIFRLWNLDADERQGKNARNSYIIDRLHSEYSGEWEERYSGYRLAYRTFLELDGIFTWPSESDAEPCDGGKCHALSQQIAILVDGTVVPCCLDSEGQIPLGNIFASSLSDILLTKTAKNMLDGFRQGKMTHPVCKKCTYARRFKV